MKYANIILDFDFVILNSNKPKIISGLMSDWNLNRIETYFYVINNDYQWLNLTDFILLRQNRAMAI